MLGKEKHKLFIKILDDAKFFFGLFGTAGIFYFISIVLGIATAILYYLFSLISFSGWIVFVLLGFGAISVVIGFIGFI